MTIKEAPRVLVVDDEKGVCILLEHVLLDMGCDVVCAESAEEAWEHITQDPAFDLVLLDKNLPDRSGLDLLAEAKGYDPDLEIVMITGYASLDSAVSALRFGAGDYLQKPFEELSLLRGKLKNAFERARRARERTGLISDLKEREASLESEVAQRTAECKSIMQSLERRDGERRRLMANLAHDLKTPLTTIQGYVDILLKGNLAPDRQSAHLKTILLQCRRLSRFTKDLTFLARQAEGRLEWFFSRLETEVLLKKVVEDLNPVFQQIGVGFEYSIEDGADSFWGDEDRIVQVLSNLLCNASRFAPQGSLVMVKAEPDEGLVLFSVSDAGVGVPIEHRTLIFERYHSADVAGRGEGLGLSICRDIVEAHGGSIWVDEEQDVGARFVFSLPTQKPSGPDFQ